jgi:pimeloyl-ACP methyl ester carboxylesterase
MDYKPLDYRIYAASMTSLIQARATVGAQTARLSDGDTAYHRAGDDGPWVVLVHGLVTPSYAWEALAGTLVTEGFRVLRYDEFGRGLSERPPVRYDLDLYVRQLRELTDFLGIETMHLIGWSMGGVIVTRFAAGQRARVACLRPTSITASGSGSVDGDRQSFAPDRFEPTVPAWSVQLFSS